METNETKKENIVKHIYILKIIKNKRRRRSKIKCKKM
jgi:hypothetical protein